MSKLALLSGEPKRLTDKVVAKLEELSGYASEDVRLLAEHQSGYRDKIGQLGLDCDDTTPQELYHVLKAKFEGDMQALAQANNYEELNRLERAQKIAELAASRQPDVTVLAIKKPKLKALLRDNPPHHLMKRLNYRSLESMTKREDVSQLLAASVITEPASWNKKLLGSLRRLKSVDFEERKISYIAATGQKWASFAALSSPVNYVPIAATVLVWPVKALDEPGSISYSLLALQAAEILETDSLYLKNYRFQTSFGRRAEKLFENSEQEELDIAGQAFFDWQSVKHLFHPKIDALAAFTNLHPSLKWWEDARKAVALDGQLVSMHLADFVSGRLHGSEFESRLAHNGVSSVKSALFERYLKYANVRNHFLGQLDMTEYALEASTDEQSIASDLEAGLI